jgi:hypothetical protein
VTWGSFDKFWANLVRDLLPHSQPGEARLDFDSASGDLIAEYRLGGRMQEPAKLPELFAFGPDGFQKPVEFRKTAPGVFRGTVSIGSRRGLFRVRPVVESEAFPEIGHYRPEDELNDYGSDELLLKQVSSFTGGRFQPKPEDLFVTGDKAVASTLRLWPGLLGLAIVLNLIELLLRKWKGILLYFRPKPA